MTEAVARPVTPPPASAPDRSPSVESVARPQATAPAAVLTMHDLFVQAGGGTADYDADRYLGLLRDHGLAGSRVGLVEILATALQECRVSAQDPETLAAALAPVLTDELGKHGYRIHDIVRCVRPKDHPLTIGEPMTPEQEAALVVPRSRPRRRRSADS